MKHFALNDQETNRLSELATWANEQSIREIYLKPFEMSVKQGGAGPVLLVGTRGHGWLPKNDTLVS